MYCDIGEYISLQSENAEYVDAFVQKLADFFATNYPDLKGFNFGYLLFIMIFYSKALQLKRNYYHKDMGRSIDIS